MRVKRVYFWVGVVVTVGILVALCVMGPRMKPLYHASAGRFWAVTAGVRLAGLRIGDLKPGYGPEEARYFGGLAVSTGSEWDRFVFGSQYPFTNYPDSPYEWISLEEAEANLPEVMGVLAQRVTAGDLGNDGARGFLRWMAMFPEGDGGVRLLVDCIDECRYERVRGEEPRWWRPLGRAYELKEDMRRVSQAARLYWFDFVFEFLFFGGLVWFTLWPWVWEGAFRAKILRAALFPFLLYLPLWFGYCNPASPAFPVGGVIYPYCNISIPWPDDGYLEDRFLMGFPPVLKCITQGRAVSFADYASVTRAVPYFNGPVKAGIYSVVLVSWMLGGHGVMKLVRRKKLERRGFPVR